MNFSTVLSYVLANQFARAIQKNVLNFTSKRNSSSFLLFSFSGLSKFRRMPSSYLLLGLDFMVTADYRVWFIEANNYPLWPKGSPFINDLMDRLGVSSVKSLML